MEGSNFFQTQSDAIGTIAKALTEAKLHNIGFDAVNPHFKNKYASLSQCCESTRGPLAAVGIVLTQAVYPCNGMHYLKTQLSHTSGEWIASYYPILVPPFKAIKDYNKNEYREVATGPQDWGSAVSYARRYSILAILGLGAEDDDANTASGISNRPTDMPPRKPIQQFSGPRYQSDDWNSDIHRTQRDLDAETAARQAAIQNNKNIDLPGRSLPKPKT